MKHPDGSPWRTWYVDDDGEAVVSDFCGGRWIYLRAPRYNTTTNPANWPEELLCVGPDRQVVGRFTSLNEWYHRWLTDLAPPDRPTFVFIDSRFVVPLMSPNPHPSTTS